jgi:hypothetical protein
MEMADLQSVKQCSLSRIVLYRHRLAPEQSPRKGGEQNTNPRISIRISFFANSSPDNHDILAPILLVVLFLQIYISPPVCSQVIPLPLSGPKFVSSSGRGSFVSMVHVVAPCLCVVLSS